MPNNIFIRYFAAIAAVILLSFTILGAFLIMQVRSYSANDTQRLLLNNAQGISTVISNTMSDILQQTDNQSVINRQVLSLLSSVINREVLSLLSHASNSTIFVVDPNGLTRICSEPERPPCVHTQNMISNRIMGIIAKKQTMTEIGTMDNLYENQYYSVGVPIVLKDGTVVGAVFSSAPADSLSQFLFVVLRIFAFSSVIVLIVAFIVIYFITYKMVQPLRKMSIAAKRFAHGDFDMRIQVKRKDEIGELAVAFNNMAGSLTQLEDMRRSFVGNVSHELRTPMTTIAGFIDGILDGTIPDEKRSYYLNIVSNEVKRLSRLIKSFLDIAKIEGGEMKCNPTEFELCELIRRVVLSFEAHIGGKNIEIKGLDIEKDIHVFADMDFIHQVIYNLVENAIKFTGQNGLINITIADDGQKVYVGIKNNGMGIPETDLPYVFDRFYKTDKSRSLDKKGTGLGLYIVKSLLDLQNEDIMVKSVEGSFCEFVFTIKKANK
jgi:signal transduction histidine kinase